MIDALGKLDKQTAVGVLARAALALDGDGNPAAEARIEGEESLRAALWQEARGHLGIGPEDRRPEAIEQVGEWLDDLSEQIIGSPDTQSALTRLADRGDLPSDLYDIRIVQNVLNIYEDDSALQSKLIQETIRAPDVEQHYGLPQGKDVPAMISLFSRSFRTPWPFKDFTVLVGAQRGDGAILHVNQAWKVYPSIVPTKGAGKDLVKVLERFADVYGEDITLGGRRGRFFVFANEPVPQDFSVNIGRRRRGRINISGFAQTDPENGKERAALVLAVDVYRYQADLKRMAVREDQIVWYRLSARLS
jgi:hypothetical protein